MPCTGDQTLEENDATTERSSSLLAGALKGVNKVSLVADHPNTAATAPSRRLQHQRVTNVRSGGYGCLDGLDRASAPRRNRHSDLLSDQFRTDLVAEFSHCRSAGSDKSHADFVTQLGKCWVFSDETPTDPGGIGLGFDEGSP